MSQKERNTRTFARAMVRNASVAPFSFDMREQLQRHATAVHMNEAELSTLRGIARLRAAQKSIAACTELLALLRATRSERKIQVRADFFSYMLRKSQAAERKLMKFAAENNKKGLST